MTSSEDLQRFVDATLKRFSRIDAVINNTGHPVKGDLLTLTDAQWQEGYDLILSSVIRLTRLIMPLMIKEKRRLHQYLKLRGEEARARAPGLKRDARGTLRMDARSCRASRASRYPREFRPTRLCR